MVVCFVCLSCFVATLSDYGLLLRKICLRLQIYWIYTDAIDLTSRRKARFRKTFFFSKSSTKSAV